MMVKVNDNPIEYGETGTVDNIVQTFTVKLRSLNGIGEYDLVRRIEQWYEVIECEESDRITYVHASQVKDFP